jgi:hypothetical protein
MDYLSWNNSIGARFFTPEVKDRRVYLYVTADLIREVGKPSGAGMPDFLVAVKRGPEWVSHGNVCERADQCLSGWRRRKLQYPPYLAYLGLFALAAGLRGDFASNAYYPRLRKLLGETPTSGTYRGFSAMRNLWEDLENWSQREMRGSQGIFQARVTSRFIHVGIPISQTILSEQERLALPSIFAEAAIDPASTPSEALLLDALIKYGGSRLRPRTRTILEERTKSEEEFEALIDAVIQELAEWDGTVIPLGEETTRRSIGQGTTVPSPAPHRRIPGSFAMDVGNGKAECDSRPVMATQLQLLDSSTRAGRTSGHGSKKRHKQRGISYENHREILGRAI